MAGLLLLLLLLIPQPSAHDIAVETVRVEKQQQFEAEHEWVSCPPMSYLDVREIKTIPLVARQETSITFFGATTTLAYGFWQKKGYATTTPIETYCKQELKKTLRPYEQVI